MPTDSTFKYVGLALLTLQQASMPLMARYSRYRDEREVFLTTVNVFMMEVVKLFTCATIIIFSSKSFFKFIQEAKEAICDNFVETAKVCLPAVIYTLQNNLYYIALTHLEATTFCSLRAQTAGKTACALRNAFVFLDRGQRRSPEVRQSRQIKIIDKEDGKFAHRDHHGFPNCINDQYYHANRATFKVAYQMKIFTTAMFMYFFLGKKLSTNQWIALIILVIGVVDVQLVYSPSNSKEAIAQNPFLGFFSVIVMCFTSAFADGFFRGWDATVVCLTLMNSIGGLLISVVIKYADNILKAYAQYTAVRTNGRECTVQQHET
ncbi:Nucleotide-sugar transporter [Necator americanus]|uniref:Nucleotide-sugar transporter n=1 Tax=Necator americanus TaxID=51031 RepID=W2TKJ3_NECAM|nr:Nucleotide-sugar transporter [Necator americanus]ETN82278.1 Nucleotide-sugar transporter [Necator americanus]